MILPEVYGSRCFIYRDSEGSYKIYLLKPGDRYEPIEGFVDTLTCDPPRIEIRCSDEEIWGKLVDVIEGDFIGEYEHSSQAHQAAHDLQIVRSMMEC